MPVREFVTWLAFHRTSPIDDSRCFDLPAARVSTNVLRAFGGKSKIEDHMPKWKPPAKVIKRKPGQLSENERAFLSRRQPADEE